MVLLVHLNAPSNDLGVFVTSNSTQPGVVVSACTGLAGTCDAVDHDGGGGTGIRPFRQGEGGGSFHMFDLPPK